MTRLRLDEKKLTEKKKFRALRAEWMDGGEIGKQEAES
jgi:hypothetical protein